MRTTFLIANLHCPSCVSNIESALLSLRPKPISVSTSLVSQTVIVSHEKDLPETALVEALEDAGYDIYGISYEDSPYRDYEEPPSGDEDGWLEQAIARWKRRSAKRKSISDEEKLRTHIDNCDMCRSERTGHAEKKRLDSSSTIVGSTDDENTTFSDPASQKPFVVVDQATAPSLFQATMAIGGMTCGSCVARVSEALEGAPWVRSADVNLLTHSASVTFQGEEHQRLLVDLVEDIGYEASVEEVHSLSKPAAGKAKTGDKWRAQLAVGGMTCSSCVATITNALQALDWVDFVNVNLISHSATVEFRGKGNSAKIVETIEDIGYEASLDSVTEASNETQVQTRRSVSFKISGIYCQHCPVRIQAAVKKLGHDLTIDKDPTRKNPIITVSYTPEPPVFTIRSILETLSAVDPAFNVTIYHPPTLSERSQMIHKKEQRRLLLRLCLTFTIAIPTFVIGIVYMSLVPQHNSGRMFLMQPIWSGRVSRAEWALFIMATPVYFLAADVFHRRAIKEVRALWRPGSKTPLLRRFYRFGSMNMLMSLGTSIAYFASIAELVIDATSRSHHSDGMNMASNSSYFDSVVFLTFFLLIGRLIESYSKSRTDDAVQMLGKLRPTEALLVQQADKESVEPSTSRINIDLLEVGDVVRILHGGSPPADGSVLQGESKFDEASLTGESKPVTKTPGSQVFSGTVNVGTPVTVKITGRGGNSMLDQIIKVVREGQTKRAPIERFADSLTGYFVPFITLVAVVTWVIWMALGMSGALPASYLDIDTGGWPLWSLQFAIAVFVIACPCGIALAAPTALFVGGGLAAQHGILVKGGGEAFQEASGLDVIVFDKTGTLTEGGEPSITDHTYLGTEEDKKTLLSVIREVEGQSSHPVAKAIVTFCQAQGTRNVEIRDVKEIPGKGMRAGGEGMDILIGNEALMSDYNISITAEVSSTMDNWKSEGNSIALVATRPTATAGSSSSWSITLALAAADAIRPEAPHVVAALQKRDISVWMISGDNAKTAVAVAAMVGIPESQVIAGVLPAQKQDKILWLQKSLKKRAAKRWTWPWQRGRKTHGAEEEVLEKEERAIVAMVGDGINDSPALTAADVGIAIGSGSDIAISSAEFVLISSRLTSLLTLIDLSRTVFRRIKFNFGWALVYNLVALPVAAGVLYPVRTGGGGHVRLDPVWASLAMALSSISVVCSSLLLRSGIPGVGFKKVKEVQE